MTSLLCTELCLHSRYLFAHDDTYIFKPPLLEMLAKYKPDERVIIGQRTCQPRQVQCRIGGLYGAAQVQMVCQS